MYVEPNEFIVIKFNYETIAQQFIGNLCKES